ncbi:MULTISPECIES: ATP-binding protein [unclassified Microcystis]|jgi:predicted ATPase|uniref:AAA family ATPase n=1 Tax=unclassified Microcystis TaxID=2643300 RepID=UPI002584A675|nr:MULTISPECIES: ATP-binding protein [unclassified Microcystis]MCA6572846.1 AAA family ATPase [Pseudanabaena sp. M53BS1SP1A06MG]MCA6581293.1 AAA family ATPase [Pseudanabaena sp. M34BS1SP1A06MG]MCA6590618.1 AAA family ATPase [Pseudanabaena sp. M38BS1SP1A06MG]MCA6610888.1 AAA family ATPase [Pseudanabaena sp. M158S2SP1A06QC]MCA2537649.1 AAA family ATPase [Microcystis sp. M57BS1]
MKLHSLEIENFRAIKHLELDFTDKLSRPRLMTLIVGPNASGKTSILDAIDIVVKTFEDSQNPKLRDGLIFSPQQIVRGKGYVANIGFEYSINKDEAEVIKKIYADLGISAFLEEEKKFPIQESLKFTWFFPPSHTMERFKTFDFDESTDLHNVLGARGIAEQAIARDLESQSILEHIGGVCYLDQRRTVRLDHSIFNNKNEENIGNDVLLSLYRYYSRHITWNEEKFGESYWTRIKRLFNKICYPAELVRFESGPDSDTLIFRKNELEYDLYQMSSGEHQVLRILVGLTSARAKNSIVLIDEIELNLHPTWQKRLIRALRDDTDNNQYIFTTHSPDVIGLFYNSEIIHLGDLLE